MASLEAVKSQYAKEAFFTVSDVKSDAFFQSASKTPRPAGVPFQYAVVAFDDLGGELQGDLEPLAPFVSVPPVIKEMQSGEDRGEMEDQKETNGFEDQKEANGFKDQKDVFEDQKEVKKSSSSQTKSKSTLRNNGKGSASSFLSQQQDKKNPRQNQNEKSKPHHLRSSPSQTKEKKTTQSDSGRLTTIWLGPSGATTQAHYDVQDNFYAQLYGRKRFIIFPPEQHRQMHLNGFLHSAAQQSQVDLEEPEYEKTPLFKDASALDVTLLPGDVLFLPALWFHHVIALDLSFSVSIWSRNQEVVPMWMAEKISPAIPSSWPPLKLALSGHLFLLRLFYSSFDDILDPDTHDFTLSVQRGLHPFLSSPSSPSFSYLSSFSSFALDLFSLRYLPLTLKLPSLSRSHLLNPDQFCHLSLLQSSSDFSLSPQELSALYSSADEVSSLMRRVSNPHHRAIWVANFFEHVSLAVSQLPNMVAYLQSLGECQ